MITVCETIWLIDHDNQTPREKQKEGENEHKGVSNR